MFQSFIRTCDSNQLIRLQIVCYLWAFRCYRTIKKVYNEKYSREGKSRKQLQLREASQDGQRGRTHHEPTRVATYPKLWTLVAWYELVSTSLMLYNLFKYIVPQVVNEELTISQWDRWNSTRAFAVNESGLGDWSLSSVIEKRHCFLLGRFMIHRKSRSVCVSMVCGFHIFWRILMPRLNRSHNFDLFTFILQDERSIKHYLAELQSRQFMEHIGIEWTSDKEPAPDLIRPLKEVERSAHPFDEFMCYHVQLGGKFYLKLRSNRSVEAHRLLRRQLGRLTLLNCTVLGLLALILGSVIFAFTMFDSRYLDDYPNCDPEMERLRVLRKLSRWSITLTWGHRTAALLFDLIENGCIYLDSALAVTFVFGVPYILTYDMILASSSLNRKVLFSAREAKAKVPFGAKELSLLAGGTNGRSQDRDNPSQLQPLIFLSEARSGVRHLVLAESQDSRNIKSPHPSSHMIEAREQWKCAMFQLQWELKDFFAQIRQADTLISDFLTISIGLWISGVVIFGYQLIGAITKHDLSDRTLARYLSSSMDFAGFLPISAISLTFFTFYRSCQRLYVRLNTLMAYDRSDVKDNFMKILDLFTFKRRFNFTLFHQYPYTNMRYLSLCSWSVSGLAILLSLSDFH